MCQCRDTKALCANGYFPWFVEMLQESCLACHGTGDLIRPCRSCNGNGRLSYRLWLPDNENETQELLTELETRVEEGAGGWVLVDALRAAHKHCEQHASSHLFSKHVLDRLEVIERRLPPRCSHCNGRGTDSVAGMSCVFCAGSGYQLGPSMSRQAGEGTAETTKAVEMHCSNNAGQMHTITDNKQLAAEYFKCVSPLASDWRTYLAIRKAIAESSFDFCKRFRTKGSLGGCKVVGIGRQTLHILERILREGSDAVSRVVMQQRENGLRPQPGTEVSTEISDNAEMLGIVDNARRALEQDSD
jgi:hypothetical protein